MPTWTRGRLRTLVFLALLAALLAVVLSLLYFRAGPRIPEGADIVREGSPGPPVGRAGETGREIVLGAGSEGSGTGRGVEAKLAGRG